MQTIAIIPVLLFLERNKAIISLDSIAAILQINRYKLQQAIVDSAYYPDQVHSFSDEQIKALLEMGERLGVIHKGTEFEIVPIHGEVDIDKYIPVTQDFLDTMKIRLAEKMGRHLYNEGFISFAQIPAEQIRQRNQMLPCWQLKANFRVLKEK